MSSSQRLTLHQSVSLGGRRLWLVLALLLSLSGRRANAQQIVPHSLAGMHVGEVVTVEGLVRDVHISTRHRMVYFNFTAPYPAQTFSAIVPDSAFDRFADAAKWGMTRVRVTGLVWLQEGRTPAVTLADPALLQPAP
jgi:hypothetical protein